MRYLFLFLLFFMIGCSKDPNDFSSMDEVELVKRSEELFKSQEYLKATICLETFIKKYPGNPQTPAILKNLASIYSNELKDITKAAEQYKKIINEYPQSNDCPNAIFTLAFIYNEQKNFDQAGVYYEMFLQKYPNHEAAPSAQFELANLGKTLDDILQKISTDSIQKRKK